MTEIPENTNPSVENEPQPSEATKPETDPSSATIQEKAFDQPIIEGAFIFHLIENKTLTFDIKVSEDDCRKLMDSTANSLQDPDNYRIVLIADSTKKCVIPTKNILYFEVVVHKVTKNGE